MVTLKKVIFLFLFIASACVVVAQHSANIEFIENKGQWDNRVRYKGDVKDGAVFIRNTGFTILQHNKQDMAVIQDMLHGHSHEISGGAAQRQINTLRSHSYNVDFVGASGKSQIVAEKPAEGVVNYYIGNDPEKWASLCKLYQVVTIKDIYPNIDARFYTSNGILKYDIIVNPGADINRIALRYTGADKIQVKNKELAVSTSVGELRESAPYTYQPGLNGRKELSAKYVVRDSIVRFDIKGYDPSVIMVIDPSLVFCSLTGSSANNWGFTATYGPDGSFYGGGIVFGTGFPVSPGAFQTSFGGGATENSIPAFDMGIIRLSANGGSRLFATYIGGSHNEQPHSLIVDPGGNMVLAGRSASPNYPVTNNGTLAGSGYDIVVTRLGPTGNLLASKKIGGSSNDGVNISVNRGLSSLQQNYGDDGRSEVLLDAGGNVYVASSTQSTNFPVTGGVFQGAFGGGLQDGVVLKFNPDLSNLLFASYLGGSADDAAYVLAINPLTGDVFVAGGTSSTNFPGNHSGTIFPTSRGSIDGFIAQINPAGTGIIRSTYLGTPQIDQIYGIQFDRRGFPYIMGQTNGTWPVQNATYVNAGAKQFIAKLQPDLSAFVYSTTFGSNNAPRPNISPVAFLVDRCENVYVSGWGGTGLGNFNSLVGTRGMPVTADASSVQRQPPDGADFYFFVLQRDATAQLFGSFFGQNGGTPDHVDGGTSRFDPHGVIYQAMCSNCSGGTPPTTFGVWAPNNLSTQCNLGMVKIRFDLAGVGSQVQSAIGGVPRDTAGCVPLEVVFTDEIRNAVEYIWNFGDGTPDVGPLPAATGYTQAHTFTAVGDYRVMLVAINPASCNERDTSYINIRVGDLEARLQASFTKLEPCEAYNYRFDNLTPTDPRHPFTATSFIWNFGDGSPRVVGGLNSVNHTYADTGTYTAWLVLNDTAFCNYPDSIPIQVNVAANVEARFQTPPDGCAPYTAVFNNTSLGGATYEWIFGDGNTSTERNPVNVYTLPGVYDVRLVVNDPNTCNRTDTAYFTITVVEKPTAAFTHSPVIPVENTETVFTNLSSLDAVRFKWLFGDGDSIVTTSRLDVRHQYNATGTFNACLIAYNVQGCPDTVCQDVSTLVVPALDVPNAFTPNSNDINRIVRVRGFGIAKMRFIIWNRWGQKVFETGNRSEGWDGRVKGVVQPMDVYAYTLDVEFFDGTKATKKGDITLIR